MLARRPGERQFRIVHLARALLRQGGRLTCGQNRTDRSKVGNRAEGYKVRNLLTVVKK